MVRGGKALLRKRGGLTQAGLTEAWWRKTATANRTSPPDQATQDRPGPPATQNHALPAQHTLPAQ